MAIVNLSPDSFYSQSTSKIGDDLLKKAEEQIAQGADILDLGVCSTRPNSDAVGVETELKRLADSVHVIKQAFPDILISIDSYLPTTVQEALNQGADFVNDVSGLGHENGLGELAKQFSVPYILMDNPVPVHQPQKYDSGNTLQALIKRLNQKRQALLDFGLKDIVIDPGFGFGKTTEENYAILKELELFGCLDAPLMVALSRKRFVCEAINKLPENAGLASSYLNAMAATKGASIIRTHDSGLCSELLKLNERLMF